MDFENIKELIKIFDDSSLSRLKVAKDDFSLTLEKSTAKTEIITQAISQKSEEVKANQTKVAEVGETNQGDYTKSPMVGTFYLAPSPGAEVFIKKGDSVKKGQTLCILEAMKIMNEIEAEFNCKIIDILVEDGQAIEYDMPLFLVEKI